MYLPVSQRYCLARLLPSQGKHRTKVGNAVYSQEHTQESRSNQHSTAYTSTHTHKYTPRQGLPPDCSPSRHRLSDDYKSPADDSSDRPQHSLAAGKGTKKRGQHQRVWICRGTAEMNRSLLPKKWIRQWRKQFLKILFFLIWREIVDISIFWKVSVTINVTRERWPYSRSCKLSG